MSDTGAQNLYRARVLKKSQHQGGKTHADHEDSDVVRAQWRRPFALLLPNEIEQFRDGEAERDQRQRGAHPGHLGALIREKGALERQQRAYIGPHGPQAAGRRRALVIVQRHVIQNARYGHSPAIAGSSP